MKNDLPTMKFKNKVIYGANILVADCDTSRALLELLKPRQYLEPKELMHVSKMGHKFVITGEVREFQDEVKHIKNWDEWK